MSLRDNEFSAAWRNALALSIHIESGILFARDKEYTADEIGWEIQCLLADMSIDLRALCEYYKVDGGI